MRKRIIIWIGLILIISLVGCEKTAQEYEIDMFNKNEATKVGREYMNKLSSGEENYINAFKLDHSAEGGNFIYLNYKVVRGNDKGNSIGLDSFDLKVVKNDEGYSVEEVKSQNIKQVYVNSDTLRIIDKEVGESRLFVRSKDLPKEIYSKGTNMMINKDTILQGDFSLLSLGFEGNKVAIAVKNDNKEFLAMALVKEAKETAAKTEGDNSENIDGKDLSGLFEKPIVEKIIPYDLIDNMQIEKMVFTNDDGELIVQVNIDGVSRIICYRNPIGELIQIDLDSKFPKDKYQVEIDKVNFLK